MNLNNVGSTTYTGNVNSFSGSTQSKEATNNTPVKDEENVGVIYEPSKKTETVADKKDPKVDKELITKLKADADQRLSQLKGIVEQLITKQGTAANNASIWSQFRQGVLDGTIKVDEATASQAAKDISEDGYWGVKQTSERILDFAKALTGGDSSKAEEMRNAIKKGFNAAAKLWGDKLPEISQKTYDAVMKGIDEWKNDDNE